MRPRAIYRGLLLLALCSMAPLAAQAPSTPPTPAPAATAVPAASLDDLAWLAGSWRGEVKGAGSVTRFETDYSSPQGGVILSASKAFRADGRLGWFEFERFEAKDGTLLVTPYPGGRPSVSFALAELDPAAKKAVFTNPEHDYPKRITYHRTSETQLRFLVEGCPGENAPVMEFTLTRVE